VEVRHVDHAHELLVVAHDVHVLPAVPAVERRRAEDVVEHGIAVDVLVHELADAERLGRNEGKTLRVDVLDVADELLKLRHRQRPVEVEALNVAAAELFEEAELLGALHALDDDRHRHGARHVDDGLDDVDALGLVAAVDVEELRVELDDVHVELVEHVQRGIAAAEVVHQRQKALVAQRLHRVADEIRVVHVGGLGDLDLDELSGDVVLLRQALEVRRHVDGEEIRLRDVERHGHRRVPVADPAVEPRAHVLPDVFVQIGDEAVLLQHGHELVRRHQPAVRRLPARQRLRAHDLARHGDALGLEAEEQLVVLESPLEVGQHAVFQLRLILHGVLVEADAGVVVALDLSRRDGRAVERRRNVVGVVDVADAERGHEAHGGAARDDQLMDLVEEAVDVLLVVGQQHTVVVLPQIARQTADAIRRLLEQRAHLRQQQIAGLVAVPLVEQAEILDVHGQHAPVRLAVLDQLLRFEEECPLAQQARQLVHIRGAGADRLGTLRVFLLLHVIHVDAHKPLAEAVLRAAEDDLVHPAPVPVEQLVADLLAQDARPLRARKALQQGIRLHHPAVGLAVVRVHHVLLTVAVQLGKRAAAHGREILPLRVAEDAAAVVNEVDLDQLVKEGAVQLVKIALRRGRRRSAGVLVHAAPPSPTREFAHR